MISLEFLVTSLVVALIPGTGVVFTISTGLAHGRRASVYAALGCTAGIVPHLLATVLGLAARDFLIQRGYPLEWHDYAMPHSVCIEEVELIGDWLNARCGEIVGA